VLYVSYLVTYLLNGWLNMGTTPILVFTIIFVVGYLAIWAIIYSTVKKNTDRVNELLKMKQNGIADP
jgi:putative effector of murein hydrolase